MNDMGVVMYDALEFYIKQLVYFYIHMGIAKSVVNNLDLCFVRLNDVKWCLMACNCSYTFWQTLNLEPHLILLSVSITLIHFNTEVFLVNLLFFS